MIIDWMKYENKGHVLAWVIIEAMSEIGIEKFGKFHPEKLEVEFKINGQEVPFESVMNFLQKQLDGIKKQGIEKGLCEARQQMQEYFDDMIDDIFDVRE